MDEGREEVEGGDEWSERNLIKELTLFLVNLKNDGWFGKFKSI